MDPEAWPVPSVISTISSFAGLSGEQQRATFNAGIGMVLVVPAEAAGATVEIARARGVPAWVIGDVVEAARRRRQALHRGGEGRVSGRIAVGVSPARGRTCRRWPRRADRGELGGEIALVFADHRAPGSTGRRSRALRRSSCPRATTRCSPRTLLQR
ncbi:MAG: AIR synthase-related protein [Chloroflexota bacterium]